MISSREGSLHRRARKKFQISSGKSFPISHMIWLSAFMVFAMRWIHYASIMCGFTARFPRDFLLNRSWMWGCSFAGFSIAHYHKSSIHGKVRISRGKREKSAPEVEYLRVRAGEKKALHLSDNSAKILADEIEENPINMSEKFGRFSLHVVKIYFA